MRMWVEDIAAIVSLSLFIAMILLWAKIYEHPEWLEYLDSMVQ